MTKLCCWPVTPALLCRPSCSFSSPLPQYDSRWLTVIGCSSSSPPTDLCLCFTSCFRWHHPPPPPPPPPSVFTHNICVCSPHKWTVLLQTYKVVWISLTFVLMSFVWRTLLLFVSRRRGQIKDEFTATTDLHLCYSIILLIRWFVQKLCFIFSPFCSTATYKLTWHLAHRIAWCGFVRVWICACVDSCVRVCVIS